VMAAGAIGWQFDTERDFQNNLKRFLEEPALREQMSRLAFEGAHRDFSAQAFAARAAEVYRQVLKQSDLRDPAA